MKNFILASASPRRFDLLCQMGITPIVRPTDADERVNEPLPPDEYVKLLSKRKAQAYPHSLLENDVLISADTVVAKGNEILGKPEDEKDAYRMLAALSDTHHSVYTGVTVSTKEKTLTFACESKVTFKALSDTDIKEYIATGEPMDKAGAYGIQGEAGKFVTQVTGTLSNIIGLPIEELKDILEKEFDIILPKGENR